MEDNPCGVIHGALITSWNVGNVGPNIHSLYFAPKLGTMGVDLRAMDFQTDKDMGNCNYCQFIKKNFNLDRNCDEEFTNSDFSRLGSSVR